MLKKLLVMLPLLCSSVVSQSVFAAAEVKTKAVQSEVKGDEESQFASLARSLPAFTKDVWFDQAVRQMAKTDVPAELKANYAHYISGVAMMKRVNKKEWGKFESILFVSEIRHDIEHADAESDYIGLTRAEERLFRGIFLMRFKSSPELFIQATNAWAALSDEAGTPVQELIMRRIHKTYPEAKRIKSLMQLRDMNFVNLAPKYPAAAAVLAEVQEKHPEQVGKYKTLLMAVYMCSIEFDMMLEAANISRKKAFEARFVGKGVIGKGFVDAGSAIASGASAAVSAIGGLFKKS